MGLPYEMIEKRGPHFPNTVKNEKDVQNLRVADPEESLSYVMEAIKITKERLNGRVPLIGFAGAPWTIFAYMIEGGGSKTFSRAKEMLYTNPTLSHRLLQMITDSTIAYLKAQVKSGADLIQVFDSWAGILSPEKYKEFALPYINQIGEAIEEVPKTVFAKGAFFSLNDFSQSTYNTIGLDWNTKADFAKKQLAQQKVLQGNLDPCALYADDDTIRKMTRKMLDEFGPYHHIANLGHGVYPDINPDKVKVFIEEVKEYSTKMRA
jgi:uroporphyrinogen decarboxylase